MAGDPSLSRMARWLKSGGYVPTRSGVLWNVDCTETVVRAVEARLELAVERSGGPALVVGQSRGGSIGRVLAVRRPELVDTLVTLGSPVLDQMAIKPQQWLLTGAVGILGTLGVPGLFSFRCVRGECCARVREEIAAPFPTDVRYLAFYSRRDEVVSWRACLDPAAAHVEVPSTHVGMGIDARVWERLTEELS